MTTHYGRSTYRASCGLAPSERRRVTLFRDDVDCKRCKATMQYAEAWWEARFTDLATTVVNLDCHPACVAVTGPGHTVEINTTDHGVDGETETWWRAECPTCATVLTVHPDRGEVLARARRHAVLAHVATG